MCFPPGAIRARPGRTRSPSRASRTSRALIVFSRAAKAAVNFSGMCCTTTMPGTVTGKARNKTSRAWVPPVLVPTAMTFSVLFCRSRSAETGAAIVVSREAKRWGRIFRKLARAAAFTARIISGASFCKKSFSPVCGFWIICTAPAARASKVICAPVSARLEQIITGKGCSCMILRRKVTPSIRGISISKITTSGHCRCMRSQANNGS